FNAFLLRAAENEGRAVVDRLIECAEGMYLDCTRTSSGTLSLAPVIQPVVTRRAAPRDKRIQSDPARLPTLDPKKQYAASDIVTAAMKVFACDPHVISVDADLATTSGLEAGVGAVDQRRAFNVGVAEANMMFIGEAFAALGYHAWVSTFCPFFDWK